MNFNCHVTQVPMTKPCSLRTCMWWSTNKIGCMAYPKAPEADEISDATLARHKGCSVEQVIQWKTEGNKRIEVLMTLHNLFEWLDQVPKTDWPWYKISSRPQVAKAVNSWCEQRWPYSIPELHWTTAKVAVTVHKATLLRFNTHVGKQIDWLKFLSLNASDANALAQIFKTASKENS